MIEAYLDTQPSLGNRVFVHDTAVVVGDVMLGDDVSIWPTAVVRGDVNSIAIGTRSNVQDGSVLHVTHDGPYTPGGRHLAIGDDVTVGHRAVLHACTIHELVLIGMGAVVMDDAIVERGCIVGAGALVTPGTRLLANGLYVGAPAKRVRDLPDDHIEQLHYSAAHYVRLKDRYLAAMR